MYLAVAAIVVVAVVVLSLLLIGIIPGFQHSNKSSSTLSGLTFAQARELGNSGAVAVGGGPWSFQSAVGIVTQSANTPPPAIFYACFITGSRSLVSAIPTIPTGGSLASGRASWWGLFYNNSTEVLAVVVTPGTATPVEIGTDPLQCLGNVSARNMTADASITSNASVSNIEAANNTYFAGGSQLDGEIQLGWGITGAMTRAWAIWTVWFTTCPTAYFNEASATTNGTAYTAGVNATSGAVVPGTGFGVPVECEQAQVNIV